MALAFVLVNWKTGIDEKKTLHEIRKIEGVKEAYNVFGIYSLVVKIEADSEARIKEIVHRSIRNHPDVVSTMTMIAV
ncbi:MAG: Lrp/AsnC ligand binding domain-containing protein [Desulfobacterales bacterium]|nr:Lrp/AsnC ligand binding domain-containing protein [Desulfobacterales bacterium]